MALVTGVMVDHKEVLSGWERMACKPQHCPEAHRAPSLDPARGGTASEGREARQGLATETWGNESAVMETGVWPMQRGGSGGLGTGEGTTWMGTENTALESIGGPDSVRAGAEIQAARRDKAMGRKDNDGRFS